MVTLFSSYRLQRIDAWLDPESHILGSSNQLYTALLSLGSAGLTGYGLQANIIAIPEAHTDFIFAAFGQCFGLLGTVFILLVCLLLDLYLYLCKIAYNMKKPADRYITIGVIAMLLYQQIQNLGMIVGLVPITGVTLPLISYGGSSIVSYFIAFGLILRASPNARKIQNLGMIVGLVPITGVTLPLISYGGSSIVSYFIAFGLILRASPNARKEYRIGRKNNLMAVRRMQKS